MRAFDLNIERVLENWTVAHALREVIANALDEAALTGTRQPEIFEDESGAWHVRDWGRGLRYEHLTQNESQEKLDRAEVVTGKFGVGLKDALATFDRHGVGVLIRTAHGDITVAKHAKAGFGDVSTLHAEITDPSDSSFVGTEFVLDGSAISEREVEQAKSLFLRYTGAERVGSSPYGDVVRASSFPARIYVNGLEVATEENFLFSYNITSPTAALRRALNRERSNVGRTAYADRVKEILLRCKEELVVDALVEDLGRFHRGEQHDETKWLDVAVHACQQLGARRRVVFVTSSELYSSQDAVHHATEDGYEVVIVPDVVRDKLPGLSDAAGGPLRDLGAYRKEWSESFEYDFVDPVSLNAAEAAVWKMLPAIMVARGGWPRGVQVRISETMRPDAETQADAAGVWEPSRGWIIVKRDHLSSLAEFAGTLLHEVAHAESGATDGTFEFEDALGRELGRVTAWGVVMQGSQQPAPAGPVEQSGARAGPGLRQRLGLSPRRPR